MAPRQQTPDDEKLTELIVYLSILSEGDRYYGAIKLNKLLFYADFMAYLRFGKSITGQEYQRLEHGPAPRHLRPVVERMKKVGDIVVREDNIGGFRQIRTLAKRAPKLALFSGPEVALIDETIHRFRQMSATDISDKSHDFLGWRLAKLNETIPYNVALIGARAPTKRERAQGRHLRKFAKEVLSGLK
ncbi:MAG: Panacea domain-containing protein [Candidatus Binataceae bacterium]